MPKWRQAKPLPSPACSSLQCGWWCNDVPLTSAAAAGPGSGASGYKDGSRCTVALPKNRKQNFQLQRVRF